MTSKASSLLLSHAASCGSAPVQLGDFALAQRAAKGDVAAREVVVRAVLHKVRKVANALAHTPEDADDAAQDALLEVLRSLKSYRGDAPLHAWAARLAIRHTLRLVRKERRRKSVLFVVEAPEVEVAEPADADLVLQYLRDHLRRLPERQRTTLVLRFAVGYTLEEVAEMTSASVSTVRGRIRLGLAALRRRIRRDEFIADWRRS
jgi:RNA polymerase sigma-70 factor (ECF subfamily)